MNRLRLTDVRSAIARVMNVCSTDSRVRDLANEAHRRLVAKGKWVGTVQRYRICTGTSACLTWPRQIETIEAYQICNTPGTVRNQWYEYVGHGPGLLDEDDNWFHQLVDRGTAVAFDDIIGTTKRIRVVSDVGESATARILLQGYDENANWIRTQDAGSWIDGEYVTISTGGNNSTKKFTSLTGVIKPTTNGPVRLYEYDDTTGTFSKALAYYENDETVPIYRRSMIPGLNNLSGCDGDSTCDNTKVTIIAKLRHIDVVNDNDFFLLGSISALKLMVMSILKEERNLIEEAIVYESRAIKELQDELSSFEGDGALPVLKTESSETWGAGVLTPIGWNWYRGY